MLPGINGPWLFEPGSFIKTTQIVEWVDRIQIWDYINKSLHKEFKGFLQITKFGLMSGAACEVWTKNVCELVIVA